MSHYALEVKGLEKAFTLGLGVRKRVALDSMTFSVEPGEIYGFLGPNGAGKTTSIKVLTSLLRQDAGTALVFGQDPKNPKARQRLGFLPESPVFYEHLTGMEFLTLCGTLSGMSGGTLRRRAGDLLVRVGLGHAKDLQIRRYSKGMTQRVGIAQALLHDPDLVILDEPMSGLDPMGRTDVRDLLLELQKSGKTLFFSTHIIPDVEAICTRVGIVARGKMLRVGTVPELLSEADTGQTEVLAEGLPADFSSKVGQEHAALGGRRMFVVNSGHDSNRLLGEIMSSQGRIVAVSPRQGSLEDLVVRMLTTQGVKS